MAVVNILSCRPLCLEQSLTRVVFTTSDQSEFYKSLKSFALVMAVQLALLSGFPERACLKLLRMNELTYSLLALAYTVYCLA